MKIKILVACTACLIAASIPPNANGFFVPISITESLIRFAPADVSDDAIEDTLPRRLSETIELSKRKPFRAFDPTLVNDQVADQFMRAWHYAKSGTSDVEGLVLLFRKPDGSYTASMGGWTNEYKKVSFQWRPNAIAIFHTHPNDVSPEPNGNDCRVADKFGVPIFTLTNRGAYIYDPAVGRTTKLINGIDWLEAAKWQQARVPVAARR